ncbi:MAG: hypothetical protein K1X64_15190 [Myxococcaceae bacterium]|nr:hypothetical protein [Myxococcaceae bacterium]
MLLAVAVSTFGACKCSWPCKLPDGGIISGCYTGNGASACYFETDGGVCYDFEAAVTDGGEKGSADAGQ